MASFKYGKQGPIHPPSQGGREQKEERMKGGGGRVGKESVCMSLCVLKGGVVGCLCNTYHV